MKSWLTILFAAGLLVTEAQADPGSKLFSDETTTRPSTRPSRAPASRPSAPAAAPDVTPDEPSGVVVTYEGGKVEIVALAEGLQYLSNRNYVLTDVPQSLAGLRWTRIPGKKQQSSMTLEAVERGTVYLAVDSGKERNKTPGLIALQQQLIKDGWTRTDSLPVSDTHTIELFVYKRVLEKGEGLVIEGKDVGFNGAMVGAAAIKVGG